MLPLTVLFVWRVSQVVKSMSWDALGDLLYRTLFDEAEELRGMFFNLTQVRACRLAGMLSRADAARTGWDPLRSDGTRNRKYGITTNR